MVLAIPLPPRIRRVILNAVNKPFQNATFQIGLKSGLIFVLILFIDSINRVVSVQQELDHARGPSSIHVDRSEIQARRFYAQRNMYLCGFTLFLSLILERTSKLVFELIDTQNKLRSLGVKPKSSPSTAHAAEEIATLKEKIAEREEALNNVKSQASSLRKEYYKVSEELDVNKITA